MSPRRRVRRELRIISAEPGRVVVIAFYQDTRIQIRVSKTAPSMAEASRLAYIELTHLVRIASRARQQ